MEGARRLKKYDERQVLGKHFSIFYQQDAKEKGFPELELGAGKKAGTI